MTVLYSVDGAVATITLNRPDARNALNDAMCEDLRRVAQAVDPGIRLAFVRGNGPVFCAGADVKERAGMSVEQVRARRLKAFAAYHALEALPMPSVAVVHGAALGSGVEIAAACDFIVATPDAAFGTPEAMRGTIGATQRLPRVLGKRLAKDLMFTGRRLTAAEARAAGFVSRVVTEAELEHELANIAQSIAMASPEAVRYAKQCIDRGVELDPQGALGLELMAIEAQLASGKGMGKP
ncbi:MAG TPA: enoyl-CoA hydratase/isomerase family protein [Burkholderiales bacterium]|jgi:enoyl-CoA hydratase|nr:enoyl-CoA hydratase/isomerase family protein [Burkholderiales bacterium]